jgi:ATP-dependent DNA ligase
LPQLTKVNFAGGNDRACDWINAHFADMVTLRARRGYPFDDGVKLSAAAERMGLEAVVSTRRDAPYRSGTISGWVKVKTQSWRKANRERWRLFERQ